VTSPQHKHPIYELPSPVHGTWGLELRQSEWLLLADSRR
jgi:hypothetical protein